MKRNKGFTLIELLVVIAIIGILSAIVLASLNNARTKANDARVQSEISSLRATAEMYYASSPDGYASAVVDNGCSSANAFFYETATYNVGGKKLIDDINNLTKGSGAAWSGMACYTNKTNYAVSAKLPSGAGYWCVDSSGASRNKNSTGVAYDGLHQGAGSNPAINTTTYSCM